MLHQKILIYIESYSESTNNVNLHETPSEPSNKVIDLGKVVNLKPFIVQLLINKEERYTRILLVERLTHRYWCQYDELAKILKIYILMMKLFTIDCYEIGINNNLCSVGMQNGCIEKCYI
ncbi:hypothetical protein F8M41_006228 [Gigaspora margarita]|uniref:Uncharacterized protein n=1 Tax=Gigaspora margarita TaxID=4874 RepID=A0A8H4A3Z1_GIGMA|nr:hypothetical protein F8M41_006228 [Gigaspora margarita]